MMVRSLITLLFVFIFFSTLPCYAVAETSPSKEVIIVENDWPPFFFGKSPGSLPGFAKELLTSCISETGYKPVFKFFPVKRMYAYLETGEADLAIFSYKKPRESFVKYGQTPLFITGYRPVVRADSGITVQSLQDLDTLRLGHLAGLRYSPQFYEYIKKREQEGTLITTTFGGSSLKMLLEGIIDVYVDTQESTLWRAQQKNAASQIKILDFDIKTSEYFITISKKSPRILEQEKFLNSMDRCLQSIQATGLYQEIAEKYGIHQ